MSVSVVSRKELTVKLRCARLGIRVAGVDLPESARIARRRDETLDMHIGYVRVTVSST